MSVAADSPEANALKQKIDDQGTLVRTVKTSGGDKSSVDEAVQLLLKLKTEYKTLTGIDLAGGGSSKKNKKEKKAGEKEPPKKQNQQAKKVKQEPIKENKVATPVTSSQAAGPAVSVKPTNSAPEKDMSMPAVLARLAQRASQADQIVAHLRTQLTSVRQSAALSACKVEEERLRSENDSLRVQVEQLKTRLVHAEVKNGVQQVSLPIRSSSAAPVVASKESEVLKAVQKPDTPKQSDAEPAKTKEKKKDPKSKSSSANQDNAAVDISRIDMRVGQIVGVKLHPDADSLYVEEVNLGEGKHRTILSGLVKHIPIEQMQDRLAIFMTNLKPAKMRGIFSEGMIMCGSTPEKVEIIELPSEAKIGDKVYVEGYEGTPDLQLNPKKKIFEQVQPDLAINSDGVAAYKGIPWKVKEIEGSCTVPTMRGTPIK